MRNILYSTVLIFPVNFLVVTEKYRHECTRQEQEKANFEEVSCRCECTASTKTIILPKAQRKKENKKKLTCILILKQTCLGKLPFSQ